MAGRESFDLVVGGAVVVTPDGERPATLAVRDGRIAAILPADARPGAGQTVRAGGLHVLPGIVDTHVHTRHPGHAGREDFLSGSSAAAAGGITTICEMPISKLPANSGDALLGRVAAMRPQALVDFALYGGAGHESLDTLAGQAEAGAIGFKTFLNPPPAHRADEFSGLWCADEQAVREALLGSAATGLPHGFHCEHFGLLSSLQRRLEAAGRRDGLAHAESRPPIVEELAVAGVLALAEEAGARPHIVHLSSPRSARLVRDARERGLNATAETCPPYLFLNEDALERHGPFAKCNPPVRKPADVAGLWAAVADGTIDVLGTDHSPFLEEEKACGHEDIFAAPPGLCGLEALVPLMLTAASERRLSLARLARLMAGRAAELFRLPGKGRLAEGADADFVLVDLAREWSFDSERCLTRSRANMRAWHGRPLRGAVVATYVRGRRVFEEGQVVAEPGWGRFVRPAPVG